ncbi:probable ADP-ribosylation factor GTPase-activating protein AGD14 [Malania oleifera]|uniref:probable ADP-ribosylation factor GTPase-activating protein AGD14 n=1 Tax=Malania oleifera TaxID=397392 RepID=UPI0025ADC249|nr:probable ADP-ribosylation factor GTPase-activating protein AGD14 [Malania oleifera]
MANRAKEEERIEKIIRGLLKLPQNKRCINCSSLGPQYVCTTFWTFVCTNCSGIHREFTHRVKSISMAKFTFEEVGALQAGGNERAREIYFKVWDPQRHSFPDSSNLHRLREFIKHVYVDRKYAGDRSVHKLQKIKVGEKEEFYENMKAGTYSSGSRSPSYHERSSSGGKDEKSFRYYYDERRSPRYAQENSRYGGYKRSPVRFEVVDDRVREDGLGNGRRSAISRLSNGEVKTVGKSPDLQKNVDRSRSPVVRSIKDILGVNVPSLHVGEIPKSNAGRNVGRDDETSANTQMDASCQGTEPVSGNSSKYKRINSESLIDFSTDPVPPDAAVVQTQQNPQSKDGDTWLSCASSQKKVTQASDPNSLESLLSQLSGPAVVPIGCTPGVHMSGDAPSRTPVEDNCGLLSAGASPATPAEHTSAMPTSIGVSVAASGNNVSMLPPNECAALAAPVEVASVSPNGSADSIVMVTSEQKSPSVLQHQFFSSPPANSGCSAQQIIPTVGILDTQPQTSSLAPNKEGPFTASSNQSSQVVSKPAQEMSSGFGSQHLLGEAKSCGRKELPADLFTATYTSIPAQVMCWQTVQPQGMRFSTPHNPTMMVSYMPDNQVFSNSAKSTNPFDLNAETTQARDQAFVSMAPLQGALPRAPSDASAMLPHSAFALAMPQSAYMGQQASNNMPPPRQQDLGNFGNAGSINTNQQLTSGSLAPTASNSFSSMGTNPFG